MRVAIIGAGMAGLSCGHELRRAGHDVVIFEKSRGIGGRIATRRTPEDLRFDHGAQFFTVQSKRFRQFLAGGAKKWPAVGAFDQSRDWFIGTPDIKSFLRPIAKNLNIQLSTPIEQINRQSDRWSLKGGEDNHPDFDVVVVTAPAAQTSALTSFSKRMQDDIAGVKMDPCWTLMLAFSDPVETSFDVAKSAHDTIDWMARNSSKWGRPERPDCWVIHASAQWSAAHIESNRDAVLRALLPIILPELGKREDDLIYFSAHRWRYANVAKPIGKSFIADETGSVFAAGDWCAGSCVEDAFTSGYDLAAHITSTFSA